MSSRNEMVRSVMPHLFALRHAASNLLILTAERNPEKAGRALVKLFDGCSAYAMLKATTTVKQGRCYTCVAAAAEKYTVTKKHVHR